MSYRDEGGALRVRVAMLACVGLVACSGKSADAPGGIVYAPHRVLDIPADGDIADPDVIKVGDTWYLYATNDKVDLHVWTSDDLAHWDDRGVVWQPTPGTWNAETNDGGAWAPDVEPAPDGYYMYYTANTRIGVARADSPLGPFQEITDHPLIGNGFGGRGDGVLGQPGGDLDDRAIDAFVLKASDGSLTLYYSANDPLGTLYAVPMSDYATVEPVAPTRLFGPEAAWEGVICEGPFVTEHDGEYHLTYSGNVAPTADYALGGSIGQSPLGPFTRYPDNPILKQNPDIDFYGPGHHSIVAGAHDDLLVFYHTKSTPKPGYDRRIRYAPIRYENGELHIDPPTR